MPPQDASTLRGLSTLDRAKIATQRGLKSVPILIPLWGLVICQFFSDAGTVGGLCAKRCEAVAGQGE